MIAGIWGFGVAACAAIGASWVAYEPNSFARFMGIVIVSLVGVVVLTVVTRIVDD